MTTAAKILPLPALVDLLASHRRAGRRVVLTNGGFDLLHVGHVRALEEAATLGGVLVVAVNDDATVRAAKGPGRPVVLARERAELVAALQCVDYVVVFGEPTVDGLLRLLQPAVHAKGRDYTPDTIPEQATSRELGIEVAIVGDPKMHSTTQLLARATGMREPADRVVSFARRGLRIRTLRHAHRTLERHGLFDLERLATTQDGALVHQRTDRFVRRIEVGRVPLFVKVLRPLERRRSPLCEYENIVTMRAAGFRAPEPWLAMEGRLGGERAGVLVTREVPGLPLDQYLALAAGELGPRDLAAVARGLGSAIRALHTARLFHPDLQAWHLFVEGSAAGGRRAISFLDLMRLQRGGSWVRRGKVTRGLAALALSIRGTVSERFLLEALRAYRGGTLRDARPWIRAIRQQMAHLEGRSTFRQRAAAPPPG